MELAFQFSDKFLGVDIPSLTVHMKPPHIWMKKGPKYNKIEQIDWKISMRILWWYIKNKLAMTYAMQSSPIAAFLPHIVVGSNHTTMEQVILPKLQEAEDQKRLPDLSF